MRHRVPIAVITVLTMLNHYYFSDLDPYECQKSSQKKALIITAFIILGLFDLVWTVKQCQLDFITNYPYTGIKWMYYAAVQGFTSLLSFYSVNYYLHKGVPFNCFFEYNQVKAEVFFYLSFLFIAGVSYLEHYYWKKLNTRLFSYAPYSH